MTKSNFKLPVMAFLLILLTGCATSQRAEQRTNYHSNTDGCVTFLSPFFLENKEKFENVISEGLRPREKVNLVLDVFIGDEQKIDGFNIKYLKIERESYKPFIYYHFSSNPERDKNFPQEVNRFNSIISHNVSILRIVRNEAIALLPDVQYFVVLPMTMKN